MFFPIGGIFVFGGCGSRACVVRNIIIGFFDLAMGITALVIAYAVQAQNGVNMLPLKIIGYIIAGMGLLMILLNLLSLRKFPRGEEKPSKRAEQKGQTQTESNRENVFVNE